jgi:hypothetical protein
LKATRYPALAFTVGEINVERVLEFYLTQHWSMRLRAFEQASEGSSLSPKYAIASIASPRQYFDSNFALWQGMRNGRRQFFTEIPSAGSPVLGGMRGSVRSRFLAQFRKEYGSTAYSY